MARKLKTIIVPDEQGNQVEYDVGGVDADAASAGQVLTADGNGGTRWGDIETGGDSVPTEVRRAIFNLLDNNAFANDDAYTSDLAIIQSWATEVTNITLNRTSLSFGSVQAVILQATTVPSGANIIWSTSNASVATVNSGVVTPVGNGNCTITASAGDKRATCAVSVSAFANVTNISAVYTQSGTVYNTDSLDLLKRDLVVTASYDNGTIQTVTNYALSGTLTEGTSTITVAYGGKTTTFNVMVNITISVVNGGLSSSDGSETESSTRARSAYIDIDCSPTSLSDSDGVDFDIIGITSTSGNLTANTARLASERIAVARNTAISVSVSSGYYVKIFQYATDSFILTGIGDLTSNTASGTTESTVSYIRILVKRSDGADMSESDIANLTLTIDGTSYSTSQSNIYDVVISSNALINGAVGMFWCRCYQSDGTYVEQTLPGGSNIRTTGSAYSTDLVNTSVRKIRFVFRDLNDAEITSVSGSVTVNGTVYPLSYS